MSAVVEPRLSPEKYLAGERQAGMEHEHLDAAVGASRPRRRPVPIPRCAGWLLAALISVPAGAAPATVYVAANGSDAWSGSLPAPNRARTDGPAASLARAVEAARALPRPARVVVGAGTYHLKQLVALGPQDSGLTIEAAPNARVTLSGGRVVSGWKPYRGAIRQADLSRLGLPDLSFRELYCNGRRQPLARVPNLDPKHPRIGGFLANAAVVEPGTKTRFRYRPGELHPERWTHPERALVIFHDSLNYESQWSPLKSVDPSGRVIEAEQGVYVLDTGCPFYVAGLLEELDAPGEWYVDPEKKVLYFWPPGGTLKGATVTVPALESLFTLQGDAKDGKLVERVRIAHLALRDCRGDAVHLTVARDCAIIGCGIRNVGHGVFLGEETHACRVAGCDITQTKGDGVSIQGAVDGRHMVSHHVVDNNYIWDIGYGRIHNRNGGVFLVGASDCRVTHNRIHDGPRYAIGMDVGGRNVIAWNYCHHVNLETCDTSIIEAATAWDWGKPDEAERNRRLNWGNEIHHNLIHDSGGWGRGPDGRFTFPNYSWGIYLDLHPNGWSVHDNICYNTVLGAYMINAGVDNAFESNVCVDARDFQLYLNPWSKYAMSGNRVERNVIAYLGGGAKLYQLPSYDPGHYRFRSNLVYAGKEPPRLTLPGVPARESWSEWLKRGQDEGSQAADPLFVDARRRDYRLKPGSPARRMGIRPVDLRRAGLYAGPERHTWPRPEAGVPREPADYSPQPMTATPQPPLRDYEAYAVGEPERGAHVGIEAGKSAIAVTDETAASGKQSLRFTDAPGQEHDFVPYCTYMVGLESGYVQAGFDLRWEPGAVLVYEWRDDPYQYNLGPNLVVDAQGWLSANGKRLLQLPASQWVRLDFTCGLGDQATGRYDLTVKLPGAPPAAHKGLAHAPAFRTLVCAVVMSMATEKATFYLDNVELRGR